MRLNPKKYAFGVQAEKFLGFMLTSREIKANPNKRRAILEICSPNNVKQVQRLTDRIATLSYFLSRLSSSILPMPEEASGISMDRAV